MAVEREVLVERTPTLFEGMKISWGGIFGAFGMLGHATQALGSGLSSGNVAIGERAMGRRGVAKRVAE